MILLGRHRRNGAGVRDGRLDPTPLCDTTMRHHLDTAARPQPPHKNATQDRHTRLERNDLNRRVLSPVTADIAHTRSKTHISRQQS